MEENRKKALAAALGQIEKQFGKGSVMRLGDAAASYEVETVSTGSLGLDIALGVGGLPRGRVVEIFGPEASGKTTLTLQVIAEVQRGGGTAAFVDAEHALDPSYAEKLGVNINDLLVSQPDTGEQALEITDMLVRSNAVDIVVIDVSFISVRKVIAPAMAAAKPRANFLILIKPQFELRREEIAPGGIVKDQTLHDKAILTVRECVASVGLEYLGVRPSHLLGAEGNQEYFLHARKKTLE